MSMSTHVVGFKPADRKWKDMIAAWDSCEKAGVPVPNEIQEFFGWEPPEDRPGMEVDLGDSCEEWCAEMRNGYQIDISKVPEGVRYIRVYNAY